MKPMKMEKKYRQCPYSAAELGEYYTRHIAAMTEEDLHSKFEIALELAWRDKQIAKLKENIERLKEKIEYLGYENTNWSTYARLDDFE